MTRKKKYDPIYPYPLTGVWTTPSEVPVGVRVIDGGVVKISRYVGNFDGEDEVNFPLTKTMSNIDTWQFELCGVFNSSSTSYAPLYQDTSAINGGVTNCIFVMERSALTSKLNIFYRGDTLRYTTVSDVFDNSYHEILVIRNLDTTISIYIDGVLDGSTQGIPTAIIASVEIQMGSKIASRRPNMQISSCKILGEIFPFAKGEGSIITGDNGTIANIIDLSPIGFWQKSLAPL